MFDKVVGKRCRVTEVAEKVVGVGSAKIDVVGEATVALQTPQRTILHPVWIIRNLGVEGIIGMDLWKNSGETGLTRDKGYFTLADSASVCELLAMRSLIIHL